MQLLNCLKISFLSWNLRIDIELFSLKRGYAATWISIPEIMILRNLISTWAAEWTVSRGVSILTDLQREVHTSADCPLSSNTASQKEVETMLWLSYNGSPHQLQCEGVTRNGLTVGLGQTLLAPLAVCQRGRRAIGSPLKCVSHQTMVFSDPFSRRQCAWLKHTQPNRRAAAKLVGE